MGSVFNMSMRSLSFLPELNIIDLDSDGSFQNYYNILPSDANYQPEWYHTIKGVQISYDNTKVYFNVSGAQANPVGGVFCYEFSSQTLTNVIYDEYNFSFLQTDVNGYVYCVSNDGDDLARIDPATNGITINYLLIDILSTVEAGGWFVYALPDLIDHVDPVEPLSLQVTSTYETCAGTEDGTATVTASGGTPPYTYLWDDEGNQTTATAVGLIPAEYTCTVTDDLGENESISVTISTDPTLFTHIGDWQVSTNEGITGYAAIDGNIEIFNNGIFTIDGTVEFNKYKGIIVHEGGELILSNNSLLSGLAACNNNEWEGVILNEMSIIAINSTTTISKGDLKIEPGADIILQNSTVQFEDNNVIIKPSGVLTLQNTTFTGISSNTWPGIQVWGNKNAHQFPDVDGNYQQGFLMLSSGTIIENAIVAVDLWEPENWASTGGIVHADGAVFRNNAKSIHALLYNNYHPYDPSQEMDYNSHFKNCIFEITTIYPGTETFYKHVDLAYVKGIDFRGCDFSLDENAANIYDYNHAIAGYDAGFRVYAICNSQQAPCPEEDYIRSTFTGFWSAISAVNDGSSIVTFSTDRTDFVNNAFGVRTTDMDNASVLFSDFQVGSFQDCGYGIFTDEVTGFAFEENQFTKYPSGPTANYFGISINSSNAVNDVYKNDFNGLSYANHSDGQNWDNNIVFGLEYLCNTNTNNYADFFVADYVPLVSNSGIQQGQGSVELMAGNSFSLSGATWHFYNGGEHTIDYYTDAANTPLTPELRYRVDLQACEIENTCPSHYGGGSGVLLSLSPQQEVDTEQEYYDNLTGYNNTKLLYDNYVDGGSTVSEILDIQTAQPSDMWALRSQLLGDSPHLSFEVLKEAADKTDVFTESALFDILAANPDELKKDTLISYLENKEEPLPDYMITLLQQLANGITYKTALQKQMAGYKHTYTRAAHDMIRSILNDSMMDYSELRNWSDNIGGITSDRQIISSYLAQGNFTDAFTLANLLPDLYGLTGNDSIEHLYYMDMLNFYQTLNQQGRNTFQLDSTEKASITSISNNSNGVAGKQARSILEAVYNEYCHTCSNVDGSSGYKADNIVNPNLLGESFGLDISVKPNPAKEWAAFEYSLIEEENSGEIVITNTSGKVIEMLHLAANKGQVLWDTRKLPASIYVFTIKCSGYSKSGKLVISK